MSVPNRLNPNRRFLITSASISSAVTSASTAITDLAGVKWLGVQCNLTSTTGPVTSEVFVQTSFDSGSNWIDIMAFTYSGVGSGVKFHSVTTLTGVQAATLTSGSLADNTRLNGVLGDQVRAQWSLTTDVTNAVTFSIVGVSKG